ncbi:hypothetical protein RchiOBHm_Chr7g0243551 [Rosa chinensis]|uniref:Uncharacterized protein n=1 Tax=Rosa chinensis TaxID=74649 RepID=A0A2P6PIS1_ROSCH|nr:hypothetical protein RchiOBHm_Chr7g0243551 [Rosa chinensis]
MIKNFEETLATNRLATESLNTKLGEVHLELKLKEDEIRRLITGQENLETEKYDLHMSNNDLVKRLDMSVLEIKNLEGFVHVLAAHLAELDRVSLNFLEKFDKLNSVYEACFRLVNQERDLSAKLAKRQYDQLHGRFLNLTSEKDAIQLVNQELNNKVMELQKVQESIMAQLSEECRIARERIQKLEFEAEALVSKKIETEKLVSELELQIDSLSESSRSSENKRQILLLKISALETENKDNTEKLQAEIQKKAEQIDGLLKQGETHEQHVDLMDKQVSQLHSTLEEKEQLIVQYKEREKNLEEQITEKYEVEKLEIVNMEKQKAEKLVRERAIECEKKLEECREESRQHLMHVQEEHTGAGMCGKVEHDKKERSIKAKHSEELKQIQLQAENELREKITSMRNEHEAQLKALRLQHEDEIKKLQEDLDVQKSKEEKQRALLQLQWKVMSDKPEEEQEVNSKKDSPLVGAKQTPVSTLLKKASENINSPTVMNISKHHKKVIRDEYEVETGNGRTIKRKLRSTVMFEGSKGEGQPRPSNIVDLFSKGSLNPYADDPYAFD